MQNVTPSQSLTKAEFHRRLRMWIATSDDEFVGEIPDVNKNTPWIHIQDGGRLFKLHADTKRIGVEGYLGSLTRKTRSE
jgi:hypothetical protein